MSWARFEGLCKGVPTGILTGQGAQRLRGYSAFFAKLAKKGNGTSLPWLLCVLRLCVFEMPFERYRPQENRPSGRGEIIDFPRYAHIRKARNCGHHFFTPLPGLKTCRAYQAPCLLYGRGHAMKVKVSLGS